MPETYVVKAKAENVLIALQRLTSWLLRNRLEVQELRVEGKSQLCLTLQTDEKSLERLLKQLRKYVDLRDVQSEMKK